MFPFIFCAGENWLVMARARASHHRFDFCVLCCWVGGRGLKGICGCKFVDLLGTVQ